MAASTTTATSKVGKRKTVASTPRKTRPKRDTSTARAADSGATEAVYRGRLQIEKDGVTFLGAGRIDLLQAVERAGSITKAAKLVGMSYKGAWDAIDGMSNVAGQPLVVGTTGGGRGGGTRLTDYGRKLLALVRAIEAEYQQALKLLDERGEDFSEYRRLLRRFSVRSSARNQFVGEISGLNIGPIYTTVHIALDGITELAAKITSESAQELGLAVGQEVCALVKASSVRVEPAKKGVQRAVNHWNGTIAHVHAVGGDHEFRVALHGGRSIAAVIPGQTKLWRATEVTVSIDPSAVILVML